jgi:hypothetical protein
MDKLDGRSVLIYIDPGTNTPAAVFVSAASAEIKDQEVRLNNGTIVRSGVLVDRNGKKRTAELPQQIFTRCYGLALTFPGSEVFGQQ